MTEIHIKYEKLSKLKKEDARNLEKGVFGDPTGITGGTREKQVIGCFGVAKRADTAGTERGTTKDWNRQDTTGTNQEVIHEAEVVRVKPLRGRSVLEALQMTSVLEAEAS